MLRQGRGVIPLFLLLLMELVPACRFFGDRPERIPSPGSSSGGSLGGGDPGTPGPKDLVTFTPVGAAFGDSDLIDLEFLPGQNGESLVISKDGTVFYVDADFTPLTETEFIFVEDGGERGLLNVVADPDYANNHYVYLYYTAGGVSPDLNRVKRYTVEADVAGGTFELTEPLLIAQFSKNKSPNPASNHNGGGLSFDADGNLLIGVGDGGGGASADLTLNISQDLEVRLGKIHRIIPEREAVPSPTPFPAVEHFAVPDGQEVSVEEPSIYALGVRNPLSVAFYGGELFVGDLGRNHFEEIDCVKEQGDNFGWPQCEGPCADPDFQNPVYGYAHDDLAFFEDDPFFQDATPAPEESRDVRILSVYQGDEYERLLTDRLIYTDFSLGWVRAMRVDVLDPLDDRHIGHEAALMSLQTNPADGRLYGISFGSDRIVRMDLIE